MSDLETFAQTRGIKYFLVNYTDLFGGQRAKLVPAASIAAAEKNGAGFAGFASWLDMSPADPDPIAMPDAGSVFQLPWKPEVAWVPSDLVMDGKIVKQGPRYALKSVMEKAKEQGLAFKTGVEPEFFLLDESGKALSDDQDNASKPCYAQEAIMRRFDVISEICDYLQELGWGPYQNDHEDANGQFEINWEFDDALRTADKHTFFKFLVKSVAERHGYRATFMPKPFGHLSGNGCHIHLSGWNISDNSNAFMNTDGSEELNSTAMHFLGGAMHHAPAVTAFTNPIVNSYRRLQLATTVSGATWAPNTISWAGNNRTHMVRIPGNDRIEFRLPDGAANPYLMQAALIAAGMNGIDNKIDPPARSDFDMYTHQSADNDIPRLPTDLSRALEAVKADTSFIGALGNDVVSAFLKLKKSEWQDYLAHFGEWERKNGLDI